MRDFEITPTLPQLIIPAPQCGHCGNDVGIEEGIAWCENCRVAWGCIEDGEESQPDPDAEGSDVACEIVPRPSALTGGTLIYGECILPSGHEGEHLTPYRRDIAWTDERR